MSLCPRPRFDIVASSYAGAQVASSSSPCIATRDSLQAVSRVELSRILKIVFRTASCGPRAHTHVELCGTLCGPARETLNSRASPWVSCRLAAPRKSSLALRFGLICRFVRLPFLSHACQIVVALPPIAAASSSATHSRLNAVDLPFVPRFVRRSQSHTMVLTA